MTSSQQGLTLIEVLIALVIVAVAFAALLNAATEAINHSRLLKHKTLAHWVAMQGINFAQTGLVSVSNFQANHYKTRMFHQDFYWRVEVQPTGLNRVDALVVRVRNAPRGPYTEVLRTFRVHSDG